jgi:hypothetical protein
MRVALPAAHAVRRSPHGGGPTPECQRHPTPPVSTKGRRRAAEAAAAGPAGAQGGDIAGAEMAGTGQLDPDGLAGSGSNDYMIDDAFVPENCTFIPGQRRRPEPLYAWYGMSVARYRCRAGRHGRSTRECARSIGPQDQQGNHAPATDEPAVLDPLARAASMIGASRSFVFDTLGDLSATIDAGQELSVDQRVQGAGLCRPSRHDVPRCGAAVGRHCRSGALQRSTPLHRHLLDLNMITQHGLTQKRFCQRTGGLYFSRQPPVPGY